MSWDFFYIILLLIYLLSPTCNYITDRTESSTPPKPPTEEILGPIEKEKLARSLFTTALTYEKKYYFITRSTRDAYIAIDNYKEYYYLTPNGDDAAQALLRMGELYYDIGDHSSAKNTLSILESRRDFMRSYRLEIYFLRKKIYGTD